MRDRRCPDCAARMEDVTGRARGSTIVATRVASDGVLGTHGVDHTTAFTTRMCPECGLLRRYADIG